MDRIDNTTSLIICENVQIPDWIRVNPTFVKCALLIMRGFGSPGQPIYFDREELLMRTQLKKRTAENVMKALLELRFIEQVRKPSHGHPAGYELNHDAMIPYVPQAALDRAQQRINSIRKRQSGSQAKPESSTAKPEPRVHQVHTSADGTCAPGAPTCAPPAPTCAPDALTCAPGAHDIKEETAIPAKPAAAAARAPRQQLGADALLANAAAAAAFMNRAGWERLGKRAGLDRDIAQQCARVIDELGIMSVELGLKAMERLAEKIKRESVHSPAGFLVSQLRQPGGPDDNAITNQRHRAIKHKRDKFRKAFVASCADRQWFEQVRYRTQRLLRNYISEEVMSELMPNDRFRQRPGDWPTMLDFMAAHWESIWEMETEDVA